jgi:hypothetical protein
MIMKIEIGILKIKSIGRVRTTFGCRSHETYWSFKGLKLIDAMLKSFGRSRKTIP